jgi:hypothetical protein
MAGFAVITLVNRNWAPGWLLTSICAAVLTFLSIAVDRHVLLTILYAVLAILNFLFFFVYRKDEDAETS